MRRPLLILLSSVLLAVVAVPPTASARDTRIACWNKTFPGFGDDPQFRSEPHRCVIFKNHAQSYAEGVVRAGSLKWKWGQRKAVGKGKMFVSTAGFFPVKIHLWKPQNRCGRTVFSRVRYRAKGGHGVGGFGDEWRTYTC